MHALALRQCCLAARRLSQAAARTSAAQPPRLAPCRAASSDGGSSSGSSGGSGGSSSGAIAPPDVRELARMAHISVTDEEVADWGPKIESIVEWFGQLQEVDVEGVPPALRADVEGEGALRPDEAQQYEGQAEMLQQAPDREGAFLRVPKIATAADN